MKVRAAAWGHRRGRATIAEVVLDATERLLAALLERNAVDRTT